MEEANPIYRHIDMEHAADAQFIVLGENGTRPVMNKTISAGNSSKSMAKAIDALFSGTICSLSMMSPLVHAGSDEAYARVLVAARVMEVTSIELEVALYHDGTFTRRPISYHLVILAILNSGYLVGSGGAPRSLESVVLSGSQFYRDTLPRTENRESVRRPLADRTHGFHGEDDCTEGFTAITTDHWRK